MNTLWLSHFTSTSSIGRGLGPTLAALQAGSPGLAPCDFDGVELATYIGKVAGVDDCVLPARLAEHDCRNNRLALMGLSQDDFDLAVRAAIEKYGAKRIGIFLGTSTSGILQAEHAYRRRDPLTGALPADFHYAKTQNVFSLVDFTQKYFDLQGPAFAVSSACSSSSKVFASARRMLEAGLIDAALVGGVDSLCQTTLYGFHSLGLVSGQACRPFDIDRDGLSIGEAAAFALLERTPENLDENDVLLLGLGESSDAFHMSSPHPEGLGAQMAMASALRLANLEPSQIDYVNLHGTATQSNDAVEGAAVCTLFGAATPCSSTKGATGHALGAAGGLEAVICALALQNGLIPGGLNTRRIEPDVDFDYVITNRHQPLNRVLSNSLGFGGTNSSLIFGRAGSA